MTLDAVVQQQTRGTLPLPSPSPPDLSLACLVSALRSLQFPCCVVAKTVRNVQLGKRLSPGFTRESLSLRTCQQHLSSGLTCCNGDLSGRRESLPVFVSHPAQSKELDSSVVEELQRVMKNSVIPLILKPSVGYCNRYNCQRALEVALRFCRKSVVLCRIL